jgi:hypothetical protein
MLHTWFGLSPLFAWNPDGHCMTTGIALTAALTALNLSGRLKGLGVTQWFMEKMMAWMPLNNCCEDVDWGNFSDKIPGDPLGKAADGIVSRFGATSSPLVNYMAHDCAIALKGDQIKHFMISLDEGAVGAYFTSARHIKDSCRQAWDHFNEAFPRRTGWLGSLEGKWLELKETHLGDAKVASVMRDYIEKHGSDTAGAILGVAGAYLLEGDPQSDFQKGQHFLGAALHTLQDSFSPAHTFRNPSNRHLIEDVYSYDKSNQEDKNPQCSLVIVRSGDDGWPGHKIYDRWFWDNQTRLLRQDAQTASKELIMCVIDNVHKREGDFLRELDNTLFKWMANHITM